MNARGEPQVRSANLEQPDQVRPLGRGSGSFVDLGRGHIIGRAVLEPGWRWSVDVRPVAGTASCQIHHLQLVLSGRLGVQMDNGEAHEFGPNTVLDLPPGHDAWAVGDEQVVIVDMSGNSADFALAAPQARSVLTMLMTDIVNSTQTAARIGDAAWKQRLADHNRIVRRHLERYGGREVDTTGDGFLAAFASAESALRCALAVCRAVTDVGVDIRAGVHTGEVDLVEGGDLRGIAVHETARIMAAAGTGSVMTSALTRALAAASGLVFTSAGTHSLKGFEQPVELFSVEPPSS
jgi:class 3 adenylate cyclase